MNYTNFVMLMATIPSFDTDDNKEDEKPKPQFNGDLAKIAEFVNKQY